jgi:hypothetical protein
MSVPATDKASPAPAVTERARSAARSDPPSRVPGDHPRGLRTPRTPILPLCPHPPAGAGGLLLCLRWNLSGGLR